MQDDEVKFGRLTDTVRELETEERGSAFAAALGLIVKLFAMTGHAQ